MTTPVPTPVITAVGVTTIRDATVTLGGIPSVTNESGHRFRPTKLELRWINGELRRASLTGRRLRADGTPFARLEYAGISYIDTTDRSYFDEATGRYVHVARHGLEPTAPRWVRDLVDAHQPTQEG
jgi:hypothetical protein